MKLKFVLRIVYILLISIVSCNVAEAQTLQVFPAAIYFDNNLESNSEDALTISNNGGTQFRSPEFSFDEYSDPAAYIKGQSTRKISVEFEDENEYEITVHLLVTITKSGGTGDAIGTVCNIFIPNYLLGSREDRPIQLTGDLPEAVGKHQFEWEWEIYAIPVNEPGYSAGWNTSNTQHTYYTLLDTPHAPMSQPWIGVLDLACSWADNQNYDIGVLKKLTYGLYNCGVTYDQDVSHTNGYTNLNLSSLLSELTQPENVEMDCKDFANFLHVLSRSLGVATKYLRIAWVPYIGESPFEHYYLLPAGHNDNEVVAPANWFFHMVGWYNSKVADASTQLDHDGYHLDQNHDWLLYNGSSTSSLNTYLEELSSYSIDTTGSGVCTVF